MGNKKLDGENQSSDDPVVSTADEPTKQESRAAQRGYNLERKEREERANDECLSAHS